MWAAAVPYAAMHVVVYSEILLVTSTALDGSRLMLSSPFLRARHYACSSRNPQVRTLAYFRRLRLFSGVNPNIFWGGRSRRQRRRVGWGVWRGCPPPHWGRGLGRGLCHLRRKFLILNLKMAICGAFLVQFFAVQLKL